MARKILPYKEEYRSVCIEIFKTNIDHKRAPLVSISDAGQEVMVEVGKAQVAWINKLAKGFSGRRLNQVLKVLEEVRQYSEQN